MYKKILFSILLLIYFVPSYSQDIDNYTIEEMLNDIKCRRFEKPTLFINNHLALMEKEPVETFQDSAYIGFVTLLAYSYINEEQFYAADTLLSHAISFMSNNNRKSLLAWTLYIAYGALHYQLNNYDRALSYLSVAVDWLDNNSEKDENYAITLGMLAVCYMETKDLPSAFKKIQEAIRIIEQERPKSFSSTSNKIQIYHKAGSIYHEMKMFDKSIEYMQKAYDMSKDDSLYVAEFLNVSHNLAVYYANSGNYNESLNILHQMEKYPLTDMEKARLYENMYLNYYFEDKDAESVNYAELHSSILKKIILNVYSSFSQNTTENTGEKMIMQLNVAMGIMDKFSKNVNAIKMCYDNALFIKQIGYIPNNKIHKAAKKGSSDKCIVNQQINE